MTDTTLLSPEGVSVGAGRPPGERRAGTRRRGSRRRWVSIGGIVVAVAILAAVGGGYLWLNSKLGEIHRVAVAGLAPARGSSQVFLLTGSDTRMGETAAQARHFGTPSQVAGRRSDVIILLRLDTATGTAAMLSIPRDMFVPIYGTSSSNRINVTFNTGPGLLVRTISRDFGIAINHFAEVDFDGLGQLTDAVGGVCMTFPYPARDGSPTGHGNESGLSVATAGNHLLDGTQALSLVRSRYYEYYKGGAWRAEGTGDIGRIARQHEYMRALASTIVHSVLRSPLTARSVIDHSVSAVTVDSTLTSPRMMALAFHLRGLHPSGIPSWTMPYRAVNNYRRYGDVLMPDEAADVRVISAWRSYQATSPPPTARAAPSVSPSQVPVRVLNGSGRTGQAGGAATDLRRAGFRVTGVGDAASFDHTASVVRYPPGHAGSAATVAARVGGAVSTVRDRSLAGSTVVLITGSDYRPTAVPTGHATRAAAVPGQATLPPWDPRPCHRS